MSSEAVELVAIETLKASELFAEGGASAVILQIEATVRAIDTDISTPKARGVIASLARNVSSAKVKLDDLGKDYVADLKTQAKVVDAERKVIRDRLDALRDEVRKPLDDFETMQQARIDEHNVELAKLETAGMFEEIDPTAAAVQDRLDRVRTMGGNRDWEEFQKRADAARTKSIETLTALLAWATRREQERAELERLRADQTAREDRERLAKVAQDAGDKARLEAAAEKARIENEKSAADQRALIAEQQRHEAEERAERAAADATEAERKRVADEQAAEAREASKREANKRHRGKIHSAIKAALIQHAGLSDDLAVAAVTAIAKGDVPHTAIQY